MTEDNYKKHSKELEAIFSRNEITLLDTGIFLGFFSNEHGIIDSVFKYSYFINLNLLNNYKDYLSVIWDNIRNYNSILTSPEILDSEIFKIRKIFKTRLKGLKNLYSMGRADYNKLESIIDVIDCICKSFDGLRETLNSRLTEYDFIPNQYYRNIYYLYQNLISDFYNKFNTKIENEPICADDGLIASALMLLEHKKSPVVILSNDNGVCTRLKIFNALLRESEKEKSKICSLLKSKGISFYSLLNNDVSYKLCFDTKKSGYDINRNKNLERHLSEFRGEIKYINSLKKRLPDLH